MKSIYRSHMTNTVFGIKTQKKYKKVIAKAN